MRRSLVIGTLCAAFVAGLGAQASAEPGRLVIVGGALDRGNAEVWGAFISGLPDPATDRIAVIAAASGEPVASFESARSTLAVHGVSPERVFLVRAAVMDDPATDEDESKWAGGGFDTVEAEALRTAGGIWFTGGDQFRTARVLFDSAGRAGPVLETLRHRLAEGAVIGGSSAGAAIQSQVMILRGEGLTSLLEPLGREGTMAELVDRRLILGRGAGFFSHGVVDQHFDRQARLGRLARAVTVSPDARFGYGIDENTALVVDLASSVATVSGPGTVTVLDDLAARRGAGHAFHVEGLKLSLATAGDTIDLVTGAVTPASFKAEDLMAASRGDGGSSTGFGPALAAQTLTDRLIDGLINNEATTLDLWSAEEAGKAVRFRFEESLATTASSGRDGSDRRGHTVSGLRFSISPGTVVFREGQR